MFIINEAGLGQYHVGGDHDAAVAGLEVIDFITPF